MKVPGKPRRLEIDFVRGIAILLVMLDHFHKPVTGNRFLDAISNALAAGGGHGVDLFFVLSGYLVGGLLLREYRDTGTLQARALSDSAHVQDLAGVLLPDLLPAFRTTPPGLHASSGRTSSICRTTWAAASSQTWSLGCGGALLSLPRAAAGLCCAERHWDAKRILTHAAHPQRCRLCQHAPWWAAWATRGPRFAIASCAWIACSSA